MMTTRGQGMRLLFLLPALLIPSPGDLSAQGLSDPVQTEREIISTSAASQQRISSLARQTQDLLSEYRAVVRETLAPLMPGEKNVVMPASGPASIAMRRGVCPQAPRGLAAVVEPPRHDTPSSRRAAMAESLIGA